MFGILRPCRHSLPDDLPSMWMSHLCGLCLALRDDHGQLARVATNYDGLVVSALVTAQREDGAEAATRTAGPCPLRGMRRAEVARGEGARLAAAVSLLLAATKIDDHVSDGDGAFARPGVRSVARRVAGRWAERARAAGDDLGFDGASVVAVLDSQRAAEREATGGGDLLAVTRPTEVATGEAFAQTALLAGRPDNEERLREAGRLFGRVAHLLDAVEDQEADRALGAWNPLTATGTDAVEARRLCDDAVLGVRLALDEATFGDDRLVRALLVDELRRSVARTFAHAGHPPPSGPPAGSGQGWHAHQHPGGAAAPPPSAHGGPGGRGGRGGGGSGGRGGRGRSGGGGGDPWPAKDQGGCLCTGKCETPKLYDPPKRRGYLPGCAVMLFQCCTCQQCCRDPYPGPWSGKRREGLCSNCDCGCDCNCCCDCCDCSP